MSSEYAIDKTATANELRLHYRDWGGHGWPILLLHGLSSTAHIWDLVAPLLVGISRVIALDLRGHGQSDKPDSTYGFAEIGADVLGVVEALRLDRPVLIGHSWGAWVALWLAAHFSERVGGLVLVDGALVDLGQIGSWEETLKRLDPPEIDGMPVEEFREMVRNNIGQGLLTPAVEAALMANFWIDAEERIHRRLPRAYHLRILRAMWEQRLAPLFEQVKCPALILPVRNKEHDDPIHLTAKQAGVAKAQELIPDAVVVWLEDTFHDVPLYRPHQVAEAIKQFLQEQI